MYHKDNMNRTHIVLLIVVAATLGLVAAAPIQFHNLLSPTHTDTGGAEMGTLPFVVRGGTSLTFHSASSVGNIPYNLYIILEEL